MAPKRFWRQELMLIMPFFSLWITSLVSLVLLRVALCCPCWIKRS